MLRLIGLIVIIGLGYLFLNWEEHKGDVGVVVDQIDELAEKTTDAREDIKDKIEELKDNSND